MNKNIIELIELVHELNKGDHNITISLGKYGVEVLEFREDRCINIVERVSAYNNLHFIGFLSFTMDKQIAKVYEYLSELNKLENIKRI